MIGYNVESVVTRWHILIDDIDVTKLFANDLIPTEVLLGGAQLEHGMILHEVRTDLEVEALRLIETEVVRVHGGRAETLIHWVSDQRIVVI